MKVIYFLKKMEFWGVIGCGGVLKKPQKVLIFFASIPPMIIWELLLRRKELLCICRKYSEFLKMFPSGNLLICLSQF